MKSYHNLREIDENLPNGFHDALLKSIILNFASQSAIMELEILIGDPASPIEKEREAYKRATLKLGGVIYFVIDPVGVGGQFSSKAVRIDAGIATDDSNSRTPKPRGVLPTGAFAYWFFVDDWNSFIHVAARDATLCWE